ncbi:MULTISPECIES: SRPBCC family protein [unclassified Caballeronia]|uniref:SRPBCC family protein n=1 Tax=unclassified Caballeronia TaxID=2646786 RepID=UPI0028656435|nr:MULTISPECIES: SRPBCC family protein [unclassified Caballeronia]MDR5750724.1 SRPBCC family protein [Caballeronia sp. LZ024]MDR5842244.1 SRPBCC family protein [Caballeronia sp. LZ031]
MWAHQESIEIAAKPERIWALLSDVASWPRWNSGIERVELHGPFVTGTTFSMTVPGADTFTSRLLAVHENASFVDETILDGTRVVVLHEISPLSSGKSRVTYSTEITGPDEDEFGPMVTGDFGDVLKTLKSLVESS